MNTRINTGYPITAERLDAISREYSMDQHLIWAVFTIESNGYGFDIERRPKILFERHKFHKFTNGEFSTTHPKLSNKRAGGYSLPVKDQYLRLAEAMKLDKEAALKSCSWGIAQIMGYHANNLGYTDVYEFVEKMQENENAQMDAFISYIEVNNLIDTLSHKDWHEFAKRYNGKNYKANRYAQKMSDAFHRLEQNGDINLDVRNCQIALFCLGYDPKGIDSIFGANTQKALKKYKIDNDLEDNGKLDKTILHNLMQAAFGS